MAAHDRERRASGAKLMRTDLNESNMHTITRPSSRDAHAPLAPTTSGLHPSLASREGDARAHTFVYAQRALLA